MVDEINDYGVVNIEIDSSLGQNGTYLVKLDILIRSDLSFASDRGSTVLSAKPEMLRSVLTDPNAPGGLLNRLDSNDQTFFWTFDHGGFDGPMIDQDWGDRAYGNAATLVSWEDAGIQAADLAQWSTPL